jgi:hypothetical protein
LIHSGKLAQHKISLKILKDDRSYISESPPFNVSLTTPLSQISIQLKSGSENNYRLNWRWRLQTFTRGHMHNYAAEQFIHGGIIVVGIPKSSVIGEFESNIGITSGSENAGLEQLQGNKHCVYSGWDRIYQQ